MDYKKLESLDRDELEKLIELEKKEIDKQILNGLEADFRKIELLEMMIEQKNLNVKDTIFNCGVFEKNLIDMINTPTFDLNDYIIECYEKVEKYPDDWTAREKFEIATKLQEKIKFFGNLENDKTNIAEHISQLKRSIENDNR